MLAIDQVIKHIRFTEKTNQLIADLNQYTFEIHPAANRIEVAYAIERLFSVKVLKVNIINKAGKLKRSRGRKGRVGRTARLRKAIVLLAKEHKIEIA